MPINGFGQKEVQIREEFYIQPLVRRLKKSTSSLITVYKSNGECIYIKIS